MTYRLGGSGAVNLTTSDARTVAWMRTHHIASFDGPLAAAPRLPAAVAAARAARCSRPSAVAALGRFHISNLAPVPIGRLQGLGSAHRRAGRALLAERPFVVLDDPERFADPASLTRMAARLTVDGAAVVATADPESVESIATATGSYGEERSNGADRNRRRDGGSRRWKPVIRDAAVVLDDVGTIVEISDGAPVDDLFLVPAAVDLHLDNLVQRRRPRATVSLDHEAVITVLDAECAAAGIATVCVAARCEDSPRKGIDIADAAVLAAVIEKLAPYLCCDWRIHARVELTDDGAITSLLAVLAASSRVALISMIETSVQRRSIYHSRRRAGSTHRTGACPRPKSRMCSVSTRSDLLWSMIAGKRSRHLLFRVSITLASHDDRTPEHIEEAFDFGSRVAEFPLTMDAALRAHELGMHVVLGAPNALRGRARCRRSQRATCWQPTRFRRGSATCCARITCRRRCRQRLMRWRETNPHRCRPRST